MQIVRVVFVLLFFKSFKNEEPIKHSLYLSNFSPPYFCVQPSQHSTTKIFYLPQPFHQFRLRQGTRELENLVGNDTVLISLFFLKVWAVITGLAITNSLSLRFRKLVYCRYNKPSNPPSLIPSTYSHNFHILLIRPQEPTFPCNTVA